MKIDEFRKKLKIYGTLDDEDRLNISGAVLYPVLLSLFLKERLKYRILWLLLCELKQCLFQASLNN